MWLRHQDATYQLNKLTTLVYFKLSKYSPDAHLYLMPTQNQKSERLEDMSNEELAELQSGFLDLRNHADKHLEVILKIIQDRLEKNLIK